MAAILAEVFDAPMSDPGDLDVAMYGGVSGDWPSMEASMAEDDLLPVDATFEYAQDSVEVEMSYDGNEELAEYDMAYEDATGEELLDVEVYDLSLAPSPSAVAVDLPSIPVDVPYSTAPEPAPSGTLHLPTDSPSYHPDVVAEMNQMPTIFVQPLPTLPSLDGNASECLVPVPSSEAELSLASPALQDEPSPGTEPAPHVHLLPTTAVVSEGDVAQQEYPEGNDEERHEVQLAHVQDTDANPEEPEAQHASALPQAHDATYGIETFPDPSSTVADPHEISEGVFIDPPPAVLLSLPASVQHGECVLFNLPASSLAESDDNNMDPRVLLQERPTLYYEPLTAVFDALRQEECISTIAECAGGELVLDAYDLQLVITEDNVYASEVTLHELNILHDGSDLTGPLRLRMRTISPRFVTRYNSLREQIAHLSVGDELSEVHDSDQVDPEHRAPENFAASADEDELVNRSDDAAAGSPTPDASVANENVVPSPTSDRHPSNREQESSTNVADGELNVGLETALPGDLDESATVVDERSEEKLDADQIHQAADADEGGDYVEYNDFPDDDDGVGEDLSAELEGQPEGAGPELLVVPPEFEGDLAYSAGDEDVHPPEVHVEEEGLDKQDAQDIQNADPLAGAEDNDDIHTDISAHPDSYEDDPKANIDQLVASTLDVTAAGQSSATEYENDQGGGDDAFDNEEFDELEDDWDGRTLGGDTTVPTEDAEAASNDNSTTRSTTSSKRPFDEFELDDPDEAYLAAPTSPDAKRQKIQ